MKSLLRIGIFILYIIFAYGCMAQMTTVTGTVTDSDGTLWANGTVTVSFYPNPSNPNPANYKNCTSGASLNPTVLNPPKIYLGGSGSFSVSVYDNTQVCPQGSQWQFNICPNAVTQCGIVILPVSGASQSITTQITATIPPPRFQPLSGTFGYNDDEAILQLVQGSTYWNVTLGCQRFFSGSSWICGTGGNPYPVLSTTAFSGATIAERIANCMAALTGSGACDARGETSTLTVDEDIVWGSSSFFKTLYLPFAPIVFPNPYQFVYRGEAKIIGSGDWGTGGSTIQCNQLSAGQACMQPYFEAGFTIYHVYMSDFAILVSGTWNSGTAAIRVGDALGGTLNLPPPYGNITTAGVDVLQSKFYNILTGNSTIEDSGLQVESRWGCTCYDHFYNLIGAGKSYGAYVYTSPLTFQDGVNSGSMNNSIFTGAIEAYVEGANKFNWYNADLEGASSSNGAVLGIVPDGFNQGTGYAIGDTGSISGGGGNATYKVLKVGISGNVTRAAVLVNGTGYTNSQSQATSILTGSGSGTLRLDVIITNFIAQTLGDENLYQQTYEEAGANDYFCGAGPFILGSFGTANGATYNPTLCTGLSNGFGGPLSIFQWGPNNTPNSIGLNYLGTLKPYIILGSPLMYDSAITAAYNSSFGNSIDLWPDGPGYSGPDFNVYGKWGSSPEKVGELQVQSGATISGMITTAALPTPSNPGVVSFPTGGSTTYIYYNVAYDTNGGETLPSTATTILTGPAVLGSVQSASLVSCGTTQTYANGDVVTLLGNGSSGTATVTLGGVTSGCPTTFTIGTAGSGYAAYTAGSNNSSTNNPLSSVVYSTSGGSGVGLTLKITSSYNLITSNLVNGYVCVDTLKGNTSTLLYQYPGGTASCPGSFGQAPRFDWGQGTTSFTPLSRATTGDMKVSGVISNGGGSNTVPIVGSPTVGQASCIKSSGPPLVIGYCSTVVGAGGSCTCN